MSTAQALGGWGSPEPRQLGGPGPPPRGTCQREAGHRDTQETGTKPGQRGGLGSSPGPDCSGPCQPAGQWLRLPGPRSPRLYGKGAEVPRQSRWEEEARLPSLLFPLSPSPGPQGVWRWERQLGTEQRLGAARRSSLSRGLPRFTGFSTRNPNPNKTQHQPSPVPLCLRRLPPTGTYVAATL